VRIEEADGERLQVLKEVAPQALQRPLGHTGHDPVRDGLAEVGQDEHNQHQRCNPRQAGGILAGNEPVDGPTHQVRPDQPEKGIGDNQAQHRSEGQPERSEVREEPGQGPPRIPGLLDAREAQSTATPGQHAGLKVGGAGSGWTIGASHSWSRSAFFSCGLVGPGTSRGAQFGSGGRLICAAARPPAPAAPSPGGRRGVRLGGTGVGSLIAPLSTNCPKPELHPLQTERHHTACSRPGSATRAPLPS